MLGAFRIQGLAPTPPRTRTYQYRNPVTGIPCPEAMVQFPRNVYDSAIATYPEVRLKYLDEEMEEITVGSEEELTQRLKEGAGYDLPLFHIDSAGNKFWDDIDSITQHSNRGPHSVLCYYAFSRDQTARRLIIDYLGDFRRGFDGTSGYESSEAFRKLQAIAIAGWKAQGSKLRSYESDVDLRSEIIEKNDSEPSFQLANSHPTPAVAIVKNPVAQASKEILDTELASLRSQVDKQLADMENTSKLLDELALETDKILGHPISTRSSTEMPSGSSIQVVDDGDNHFLTAEGIRQAQEAGRRLHQQYFGSPMLSSAQSEPDLRRWASYSDGRLDGLGGSVNHEANPSTTYKRDEQDSITGNCIRERHVRFAEPIASPVTVLSEKARGKQPAARGPKEVRFALVKEEHVELESPEPQTLILSPTEHDNLRALLATLDHLQTQSDSSFIVSFRTKLAELKKPYTETPKTTKVADDNVPMNIAPSQPTDVTDAINASTEMLSARPPPASDEWSSLSGPKAVSHLNEKPAIVRTNDKSFDVEFIDQIMQGFESILSAMFSLETNVERVTTGRDSSFGVAKTLQLEHLHSNVNRFVDALSYNLQRFHKEEVKPLMDKPDRGSIISANDLILSVTHLCRRLGQDLIDGSKVGSPEFRVMDGHSETTLSPNPMSRSYATSKEADQSTMERLPKEEFQIQNAGNYPSEDGYSNRDRDPLQDIPALIPLVADAMQTPFTASVAASALEAKPVNKFDNNLSFEHATFGANDQLSDPAKQRRNSLNAYVSEPNGEVFFTGSRGDTFLTESGGATVFAEPSEWRWSSNDRSCSPPHRFQVDDFQGFSTESPMLAPSRDLRDCAWSNSNNDGGSEHGASSTTGLLDNSMPNRSNSWLSEEHLDDTTVSKIQECVESLKFLGYGSEEGGEARLVVYAQAADGSLDAALDIIDEEQSAWRRHRDSTDELL